jgi:hypothetical protein
MKAMPTQIQAGTYSAVRHYLQAVKDTGTDESLAVIAKMKETPVNDMFAARGLSATTAAWSTTCTSFRSRRRLNRAIRGTSSKSSRLFRAMKPIGHYWKANARSCDSKDDTELFRVSSICRPIQKLRADRGVRT